MAEPVWRQAVAVFCGARAGEDVRFAAALQQLGALLAQQGRTLVYGGGRVGLMGVVAEAALAEGGRVTGVIPRGLFERELGHTGLSELHVVESMHARKALMADLSGAFIAAPGGFGTLDETFEAITWTQLGLQVKPIGLLNTAGFYDPLIHFVRAQVAAGFVDSSHADALVVSAEPEGLLQALDAWLPPPPRREVRDHVPLVP